MRRCDHCGEQTQSVTPVLTEAPTFAEAQERPLSRLALYAAGWPEPPWGEHPDDNRFEFWCGSCATDLAREKGFQR